MMNGFSHAVVHPRPLRTSVLAAALFARIPLLLPRRGIDKRR
jgi:hypothetical protein